MNVVLDTNLLVSGIINFHEKKIRGGKTDKWLIGPYLSNPVSLSNLLIALSISAIVLSGNILSL